MLLSRVIHTALLYSSMLSHQIYSASDASCTARSAVDIQVSSSRRVTPM